MVVSYPYLERFNDYTVSKDGDRYLAGKAVRDLGDRGDRAQRAAVAEANARVGADYVKYVDGSKALFHDHEPDAKRGNPASWLFESGETKIISEWYHFDPNGHNRIAALVTRGFIYGARQSERRTGSADVVLVVDATQSMEAALASLRVSWPNLAAEISSLTTSTRFALVSFRDSAESTGIATDYPARLEVPFSPDPPRK